MKLRRLNGKSLEASISEGLTLSSKEAWSIPPLINRHKQWTVIDRNQAVTLLNDLADTLSACSHWINSGPVTRVRTIPLQCYSNALLCEAETQLLDGAKGLITFIWTPNTCVFLSGTSSILHKLNERGMIDLSLPDNVLQYLILFCAAVQGEHNSPFTIVSNQEDLVFYKKLKDKVSYWLPTCITPPSIPEFSKTEEMWKISTTVLYAQQLFKANFGVRPEGIIEMLDDSPIHNIGFLPVRTWGIWGNVRRDLTSMLPSAN